MEPNSNPETSNVAVEDSSGGDEASELLASAGIEVDGDDDEGTSSGAQETQVSGSEDGSGEGKATQTEEYRDLVELMRLGDDPEAKFNKAEAKRVRIAVQNRFSTDEEIDKYLAKKEGTSKSKVQDDSENEDGDKDDDSKKSTKSEKKDTDDNVSPSSAETELLKAISPHLKPGDTQKAIESIKNLQHDHSVKGEFVNHAAKYGIQSKEDLDGVVHTMNSIDSDIKARLQSPEGMKGLFEAFKVPIPDWLGKVSGSDASGFKPGQQSQDSNNNNQSPANGVNLEEALNGLDEDGIITVSQFKTLLPQIVGSIQNQVQSSFGEQTKKMESVFGYVGQALQRQQQQQTVARAVDDVSAISRNFAQFAPGLKLDANVKDIIDASIQGGKLSSTPHPEWPKVQAILNLRAKAAKRMIQEAQAQGVQLPKGYQPDVISYLSKLFMTRGGVKEVAQSAKKGAQKKLISNLAKQVQPKASGSKQSEANTFKIPKTVEDVANMSRSDRRKFKQMVTSGKLRIGH